MSRRSVSIRATTYACWTRWPRYGTKETRLLLSSTTRKRCGGAITSSILVRVQGFTAAKSWGWRARGTCAGIPGGEVVASGTLRDVERNPDSETARCLKIPLQHPTRGSRRSLRDVED